MIAETQKLEKFHSAIEDYAQKQRKTMEEEVARLKRERLAEAESQVLSESFQMRHRIAREMALREVNARRELLVKRGELTKKVFARAAEKLLAFTKTEEYPRFLEAQAKKLAPLFPAPGTVIHLRQEDQAYFPLLEAALGTACSCAADASIQTGGFYAENQALGIFVDVSFDSLLQEQIPWFEENSGIAVI